MQFRIHGLMQNTQNNNFVIFDHVINMMLFHFQRTGLREILVSVFAEDKCWIFGNSYQSIVDKFLVAVGLAFTPDINRVVEDIGKVNNRQIGERK